MNLSDSRSVADNERLRADNERLRAENQQLRDEKAALEKRVARLEADLQGLKELLDTAQRRPRPCRWGFSSCLAGWYSW